MKSMKVGTKENMFNHRSQRAQMKDLSQRIIFMTFMVKQAVLCAFAPLCEIGFKVPAQPVKF